ncbi:unnamed protein product [Prunus brigantina]
MNESSKRRLMMGLQGKKKNRQVEAAPIPSAGVDPEDQTLADRLRQLNAESTPTGVTGACSAPRERPATEAASSKAVGKRPMTVDLEAEPEPKRGSQREAPRAIFAAEDDDNPAEPVTLACPLKTVQFANHMILGSQMELSEIEELPKKLLRDELSHMTLTCCFIFQAFMDMWLCMRRAIMLPSAPRRLMTKAVPRLPRLARLSRTMPTSSRISTARLKSSLSYWTKKWARRWQTCFTDSSGTIPGSG